VTYVITQSCCNDASCVEVCPVDCIHPAPDEPEFATAEMLYIHPDECIDCGACVDACPVGAVHADLEVPSHLSDYLQINADYFAWVGDVPAPLPHPPTGPKREDQDEPLRVAVVGSGPAGWFLADELAGTRRAKVEVTLFDRLVTPHGLIRHGVAPDHLDTKQVASMFEDFTRRQPISLRLNVEVGRDVTHDDLLEHHHCVVYATGASEGRALGVQGESLRGSNAAADFVNWYNGHPDWVQLDPPLEHERAIVIGNGNVALDVARLLLVGHDELTASSDMVPHAVEALATSRIEEVVVIGRRGPEHAAFTSAELLALINHPDINVVVDPAELASLPDGEPDARTSESFAARRKADLLRRAAEGSNGGPKRLVLRFGLTPAAVVGDDQVGGLTVSRTGDEDQTETIPAGLVLRATGYRTLPAVGVPFDQGAGRFAHREGRVTDPESGAIVPRTYAVGWAKRGATGVIGTNRACAVETAAAILDDYVDGRLPETVATASALDALLAKRELAIVDLTSWQRLDEHEQALGKDIGRPRVKLADRDQQLKIASGV
jgi:ferredoxin--NADP+ reductase